jgi:hypothetical protein
MVRGPPQTGASLMVLEVFGVTIADAAGRVTPDRDLDIVELWSGVASVVRAARLDGLRAEPFDINRVPGRTDSEVPHVTENIIQKAGFMNALNLVLRVRKGGLVWMAPVCASWGWMRLAQTKRSIANNYVGDLSLPTVCTGNLMADIAVFFYRVAAIRNVQAVIENPPGSRIFKYGPLVLGLRTSPKFWATCPHCAFSSGPLKKRFGKKFKMLCTATWICGMNRVCKCPRKKHLLCVTAKIKNGKRKVWGNLELLKQSAAYPDAMGTAIIAAWKSSAVHGHRAPQMDDSGVHGRRRGGARRQAVQGSKSTVAAASVHVVTTTKRNRTWMTPSVVCEAATAFASLPTSSVASSVGKLSRSWMRPTL